GWYPSLQFDPTTQEPVIAYYVCAVRPGVTNLASCTPAEEELDITQRIGPYWYPSTVDAEGGMQPTLLYRSNGYRLVVYRDPRLGTVKIAVEQSGPPSPEPQFYWRPWRRSRAETTRSVEAWTRCSRSAFRSSRSGATTRRSRSATSTT